MTFLSSLFSRGRHAPRQGASLKGTLVTWINATVSRLQAENEKRRSADRGLDLYTNDAMTHGVLESLAVEAVGIGMTPQPQPDASWLGFDNAWALDFQRRALKGWDRWAMDLRLFCDAQGRLNFYGLQNLAYFNWKLDGMGLFQVVSREDTWRPLSLAILPLDSWRLATPTDASGKEIYDGVEVDAHGKPVAVYLRKPGAPLGNSTLGSTDRVEVFDPATGLPKVLMVCNVRNVAEYRQDGLLTPMLKTLRDGADFKQAALVRSLLQNMFVMFIQSQNGAGPATKKDWEDRFKQLEMGMILEGLPGETAQMIENNAPGNGYETMFDSLVKEVGMATGRGPEHVLRKFDASYSASRASMEKAAQQDAAEQQLVLTPRFNAPCWAWVLYESALRGRLPIRSMAHFRENLHDYCRAAWLAQPKRQIDAEKAAKADQIGLNLGTRTYQEIWGEKGQDWREGLEQVAQERAHIKDLESRYGVNMTPTPPASTPAQSGSDSEREPGDSSKDGTDE